MGSVLDCYFNKSLSHEHTFVKYWRVRFRVDKTLGFIATFCWRTENERENETGVVR